MCFDCAANRTSLPFTDVLPSAGWRPTEDMDEGTFQARSRGNHPLRRSRVWNRNFLRLDIMHNCDHRGVSGILAGSNIAEIIHECLALGKTIGQRLEAINHLEDEWQAEHVVSSRMPSLRPGNIQFGGPTKWAELHGQTVKAASTRHFMPFVQHLTFEIFGDPHGQWHKSIVAVNALQCKVYHILYSADLFLRA